MTERSRLLREMQETVTEALSRSISQRDLPLYEMLRSQLRISDVTADEPLLVQTGLLALLCCLGCGIAGGDWRRAVPAAVAIELTHAFVSFHEEIEVEELNEDDRTSTTFRWERAHRVNAGDAFWPLAWQSLTGAIGNGLPAELVLRCAERLTAQCRRLVEGQSLSLGLRGRAIDVSHYLEMVSRTGGGLAVSAFELGGLCGGATDDLTAALRQVGEALGVALRMQADSVSVQRALLFPNRFSAASVRHRKPILPAACAFEHLVDGEHAELRELWCSATPLTDDEVLTLLSLFERLNVRRCSERIAAQRLAEALDLLDDLPSAPGPRASIRSLVSVSQATRLDQM